MSALCLRLSEEVEGQRLWKGWTRRCDGRGCDDQIDAI